MFNWIARLDELWPRDGRYIKPLSEEWRQARRGRLTASGAAYPIKVFGKGIETLRLKILDALRPEWQWRELSLPQLEWGREYEPAAIARVELDLGAEVVDPGCLFHPELPYCSATPDGIIDGHISLQIKCPHNPQVHLKTFYGEKLKPLYYCQVQFEAWVANCDQIIFASFDPKQPAATRLAIREIEIDLRLQETFDTNARRFKALIEGRPDNPSRAIPITIPGP